MTTIDFRAELERYGPGAAGPPPTLADAQRYCRRLAQTHYENFTVASRLLPGGLRQHFCNIYCYCRWSDDLADETRSPEEGLTLLAWWEEQLRQCYAGQASHPVLVALSDTVREFAIPIDPLVDLLVAMRQDQQVHRYETIDHLLQYCRYSANPVGRLVLYLGRCHDDRRGRLADSVCTGLQLANFWQDVARDWNRGRLYLPLADCRRFGVDEAMLAAGRASDPLRRLLATEVELAEGWLRAGWPLVGMVPPALQVDVALFVRGGLAVLAAIRRQDYDVWSRRPVIPRREKLGILARTWWQQKRRQLSGATA